uniref:Uncharacterized protein n=1 Tax=Brassica campestris TaxID=3711 RepID=A0A3P5ZZG2_BRACM|nr:unnamed protein product [Brassica rapa]
MPSQNRPKKPRLCSLLFFTVPFSILYLFLLRTSSCSSSSTAVVSSFYVSNQPPWSGDTSEPPSSPGTALLSP